MTATPKARRLAASYALGAALTLLAAAAGTSRLSTIWLILLWPALALAIVAFGYAAAGTRVFQKAADGRLSPASRILLAPYRLGAKLNAWAWTRNLAPQIVVADGVSIGRFPSAPEANQFGTIIDLAAELEKPGSVKSAWISLPMIDLLPPPSVLQQEAAAAVENARQTGSVLVCCALGFQRSAGVIAAWLTATGRAKTPAQARELLAAAGRPVHLAEEAA